MNAASLPRVVVAGAAGGIGLEILRQLRGRAEIYAVVQNEAQVAIARDGGAVHCVICDVADAAANESATAALRTALNERLDALIFTAALQPAGAVEALSRADLERLFAVNVFGTLQFVQGLLPALRASRGRLVLFSSMAGRLVAPMLGAYSATKYALEALSDALRAELRDSGVSISLIEPGGVDTPMARGQGPIIEQGLARLSSEQRARYERLYLGYQAMTSKALKHASRPEDVARVAVEAALGVGRPKPRYLVGTDAKLMVNVIKRLLPTRAYDAFMMGISTRP